MNKIILDDYCKIPEINTKTIYVKFCNRISGKEYINRIADRNYYLSELDKRVSTRDYWSNKNE